MNPIPSGIVAAVLAGGKSRRMGQDKRFLDIAGQPLIERVLAVLKGLFPECVMVAAEREPELEALGVPVLTDIRPSHATLGGLYTALKATGKEWVFAVGADMPCLDPKTITVMAGLAPTADVVVANLATGVQPLHAIYGKACIPVLERMMDEGELKMQCLFNHPSLRVRHVDEAQLREADPLLRSFININTPADLEMVRKLLLQQARSRVPHQ